MLNNSSAPKHITNYLKSFRWTLHGGLLYEVAKIAHLLALLFFLPKNTYGIAATLFSLIYLATRFADLGATPSLPPFFHLFMENKQSFKKLLWRYVCLPYSLSTITTASLTVIGYIYFFKHNISGTVCILFFLIIITETIRSFFRLFLHAAYKSSITVLTELGALATYLSLCWVPFFLFLTPFSLEQLFGAFLIDSLFCLLGFFFIIYKTIYKNLPEPTSSDLQHIPFFQIAHARGINYFLRISSNLFTSNFLTPFFAFKFSLHHAGLLFFASTITSSIHAIIKGTIAYSGNALFTNVKHLSLYDKRDAFRLLTKKLIYITLPLIIFFISFISCFSINTYNTYHNQYIIIASFSFLLFMVLAELFFLIYEQFYILEQVPHKLLVFKLFEFTLLFFFVISGKNLTPYTALLTLAGIKCLSFSVIAMHAYLSWKIRPSWVSYKALAFIILITSTFAFAISLVISFVIGHTHFIIPYI